MSRFDPKYAQGVAALKRGDYDSAVAALESVTRADPQDFSAFVYLGAAYAEKGRYNAAIGAFKRAEEIKPDVASIHYNLGQAYEAAGVPKAACHEYQEALRINSRYGLARGALIALTNRMMEACEKRVSQAA